MVDLFSVLAMKMQVSRPRLQQLDFFGQSTEGNMKFRQGKYRVDIPKLTSGKNEKP